MDEPETILLLCALLREQTPFVHVRFGDGDVMFATGVGSKITGDGEEWNEQLSAMLQDAWLDLCCADKLLLGDLLTYRVSDGVENEWDGMMEQLLTVREPRKESITLVHMEALRVGFGFARPFYEDVRDDPRHKVFVAPQTLGPKLAPLLGADWIGVSLRTAWQEVDDIVQLIHMRQPDIALFAAGRGGKIMQGKLACSMPGLTQVDVGSGLDLLVDDGVRRGTDLGIKRGKVLAEYREAGLCP